MDYENRLENNNLSLQNITNIISNLPNISVGDVKVFETIPIMNADPNPINNGLAVVYDTNNFNGLYQYNNGYVLANTQLNATAEDVYGELNFYGANGIEVGNLQYTENLTKYQLKNKTNICSRLSYLIPMNEITDLNMIFNNCTNLIIVPNIDTSNVTSIGSMFWNCINLTTIPEFDTSNVTNMTNMFYNCNNLSNDSIQNIVNMCINSNITNIMRMNLSNENSFSPLYNTTFDNTYYSNRLVDLDEAGWTY